MLNTRLLIYESNLLDILGFGSELVMLFITYLIYRICIQVYKTKSNS